MTARSLTTGATARPAPENFRQREAGASGDPRRVRTGAGGGRGESGETPAASPPSRPKTVRTGWTRRRARPLTWSPAASSAAHGVCQTWETSLPARAHLRGAAAGMEPRRRAFPSAGRLRVTGTVGPMTRESANVAMTWVRSHAERLVGAARFDDTTDVHVHLAKGQGCGRGGCTSSPALDTRPAPRRDVLQPRRPERGDPWGLCPGEARGSALLLAAAGGCRHPGSGDRVRRHTGEEAPSSLFTG